MFSSEKKSKLLLGAKPERLPKKVIQKPEEPDTSDYDKRIEESSMRLKTLKKFADFFNMAVISNIYSQSYYLHKLFVDNKLLNVNKLDQFHYYYTDKLFDLLEKVKKGREDRINHIASRKVVIQDKIKNIDAHIDKYLENVRDSAKYKMSHSTKITTQLSALYNCLLANIDDFRYKSPSQITLFRKHLDSDAFYTVPAEVMPEILKFKETKTETNSYTYNEYTIERKLMGRLLKNLFGVTFIGSFLSGSTYFELFQITNTEDYFIYLEDTNTFKFVDFNLIKKYISDNTTKVKDYTDERNEYHLKLIEIKTMESNKDIFDPESIETLKMYLDKIESVELVEDIVDVDTERRIIESMLSLERLER